MIATIQGPAIPGRRDPFGFQMRLAFENGMKSREITWSTPRWGQVELDGRTGSTGVLTRHMMMMVVQEASVEALAPRCTAHVHVSVGLL